MTYPVFSTGDVFYASDANAIGLWKISTTTFSASAGVEIQSCFNSSFQNYKVFLTYYGSAVTNTQTQYMTGTNTKDTAATYNRWGYYWTTIINGFNLANQTSDFIANHFNAAANYSTAELTIYQPNIVNVHTVMSVRSWSGDTGLGAYLDHNKKTNSQYTGLYIFPTTGTITGTATVYGLRQ